MKIIFILLSILFSSTLVFAQNKACKLEGSFTLYGIPMVIDDCASNDGNMSFKDFKKMCSSFSSGAAALGAPPAKITYLSACPGNYQASCTGYAGKKISFYYYKRDEAALKDTKASCTSAKGTWKKK